jgi:hypothetical protein
VALRAVVAEAAEAAVAVVAAAAARQRLAARKPRPQRLHKRRKALAPDWLAN